MWIVTHNQTDGCQGVERGWRSVHLHFYKTERFPYLREIDRCSKNLRLEIVTHNQTDACLRGVEGGGDRSCPLTFGGIPLVSLPKRNSQMLEQLQAGNKMDIWGKSLTS